MKNLRFLISCRWAQKCPLKYFVVTNEFDLALKFGQCLKGKGEAIDIDQENNSIPPFSLSMGLWVVEKPVVWHANKKGKEEGYIFSTTSDPFEGGSCTSLCPP